jgi:7-carboxy-7-deazaguanine synthase
MMKTIMKNRQNHGIHHTQIKPYYRSTGGCVASYLINEIYPCLQGEGVNLGKPSLLVRFQICNLRCKWCDTPYTHTMKSDPLDSEMPSGQQNFFRLSREALVQKIQSYPQKHLILSGGEPTLHNLGDLMRDLGNVADYTFEVESNGTRIPHAQIHGFLESDYELAQWNISPKFSNAGENIEPIALVHWAKLSQKLKDVYFKFVVRENFAQEDMAEINNIVQNYGISSERVLLMPEGTDLNSQIQNQWLHDICLQTNFRYSPRLHVILFGNLRGV